MADFIALVLIHKTKEGIFVVYKTIFSAVALVFLIVFGSCNSSGNGNPATIQKTKGTKDAYGTFMVKLDVLRGVTNISGKLYDGPTPSEIIWEIDTVVGNCRLLKKRLPVCDCPFKYVCVEDDSCAPSPSKMTVDTVKVNGLKTSDGKTSFIMYPVGSIYAPDDGILYPPCSEGEIVTFITQGDSVAAPCTLTARGISPLHVLNDSILVADGQPMTLNWTPPNVPGISTIFITVDISYHAGTKGKIECECPDNGSVTIPAVLLDKLKALGMSGFPKVDISRLSTATNATGNTKLVIESITTMALTVPGVVSCTQNSNCSNGQTCGDDKRCK
jgi:hypothetical protein